jgi:hypothetical protein
MSTQADRAISSGSVDVSSGTAGAGDVIVNGYTISLTDTASQAATIAELQAGFSANGLDLTAVANGTAIDIRHNQYGSAFSVSVNDASGLLRGAGFNSDTGANVAGTINGEAATGSGLTLTANSGTAYAGTAVTFKGAVGTATFANAFSVSQGSLTFQVGSTAGDTVSTRHSRRARRGSRDNGGRFHRVERDSDRSHLQPHGGSDHGAVDHR